MQIYKIIKPENKLTEEQLERYFCCCVQGRSGDTHLDFCTVFEENNVIEGYAWTLYLTDIDYDLYKKSGNSENLRKNLKEQIIQLLTKK